MLVPDEDTFPVSQWKLPFAKVLPFRLDLLTVISLISLSCRYKTGPRRTDGFNAIAPDWLSVEIFRRLESPPIYDSIFFQ